MEYGNPGKLLIAVIALNNDEELIISNGDFKSIAEVSQLKLKLIE